MSDKKGNNILYNRSPGYQLIITLMVILGAGILIFTLFIVVGLYAFDADYKLLESFTKAANKSEMSFLRYVLIAQEVSFFIIPGVILLILLKPSYQSLFAVVKIAPGSDFLMVILLAICLFPLTSFTGYLNSAMDLPVWLSGAEQWMTEKENELADLTSLLMASDNLRDLVVNLVMIAILPAIGEELIFRGILQKILNNLIKNSWLAIGITAFVFSAIHLQFYGFLPRFILGLVYGYLFFWSGSLLLPVMAHFVNNAVPTIGAYLNTMENSGISEETPVLTQLAGLVLPIILVVLILSYFWNKRKMDLNG